MLTGQKTFRGASVADIMSAVLKEEPPDDPKTRGVSV
jgi:alkylation response protein AidB-like acyl-CoA dehydrogenase